VGTLGSVAMGFPDKAKDLLAQNADKGETRGKYTDTIHRVHHRVQEKATNAAGPAAMGDPGSPGGQGDQQS
jgi:hypothetical protein